MIITVDSLLSLEHPLYRIGEIEIYLDGVLQTHAIACDTLGDLHHKTGWVERYKTIDGIPIMCGDEFETEIVYGDVEVRVK